MGWDETSAREVAVHAVLLVVLAVTTWTRPVPAWLRLWAPLAALPILYSELPMLMRAAGQAQLFDARVIIWERLLFADQPARSLALRWPFLPLSETLHAAYLSYYGIIFSVPVLLWLQRRRSEFVTAAFALLLTFVACFAIYIVFPVGGPRYFWSSPADAIAGPIRRATLWVLETGSSRGTAFPSSHMAVAGTQAILALRFFGVRGAVIGVLAVGLGLGAVYGGFHYAIDVLAGAALGGVLTTAVLLAERRAAARAVRYANATAPT